MSGISADLAKEKLYAPAKLKQPGQGMEPQEQQKEVLVKQDPSLSGVQWAFQMDPANQSNSNLKAEGKAVEMATPADEDLALLSSTVTTRAKSVSLPDGVGIRLAARLGLNPVALEESFRSFYKQSKSHNLLLERFMSHVKFSSIKMLCSLLGMSAEEQDRVQSEVRQEALAEIDAKLRQDWAYSKALLEIVG